MSGTTKIDAVRAHRSGFSDHGQCYFVDDAFSGVSAGDSHLLFSVNSMDAHPMTVQLSLQQSNEMKGTDLLRDSPFG